MPLTPDYGLPYPAPNDAPNGPAAVENLARATEGGLHTVGDAATKAYRTDVALIVVATDQATAGPGSYSRTRDMGDKGWLIEARFVFSAAGNSASQRWHPGGGALPAPYGDDGGYTGSAFADAVFLPGAVRVSDSTDLYDLQYNFPDPGNWSIGSPGGFVNRPWAAGMVMWINAQYRRI